MGFASFQGREAITGTIALGAAQFQKSEDTPSSNADVGVAIFEVRRDVMTGSSATSDGDYATKNQDSQGFSYVRSRAFNTGTGYDDVWNNAPTETIHNYSTARGDGTAVRASDTTVTFTGPSLYLNQIRKVIVYAASTMPIILEQGKNAFLSSSVGTTTSTITVVSSSYAAPVPSTTAFIDVLWAGPDKAIDTPTNSLRSFDVAPLWSRNVQTPVALISSAQNYTMAWADLGPEIALQGYNYCCLWINHVNNQSTGTSFRALLKHTAGGTEEYPAPLLFDNVTVATFSSSMSPGYVRLTTDTTQNVVLPFRTYNAVPYIQFQCQSATTGSVSGSLTGNAATAYVTFGFGG